MVKYIATSEVTGEVIEGGAKKVAQTIGATVASIYQAIPDGMIGEWKIKRDYGDTKIDKIPPELLREWEEVTALFKAHYKRAKEKKEKYKLCK
jgi:hypothetical protein